MAQFSLGIRLVEKQTWEQIKKFSPPCSLPKPWCSTSVTTPDFLPEHCPNQWQLSPAFPLSLPLSPCQNPPGMEGTTAFKIHAEGLSCSEIKLAELGKGMVYPVRTLMLQGQSFSFQDVCAYFSPALNSFYRIKKNRKKKKPKPVSLSNSSVEFGC